MFIDYSKIKRFFTFGCSFTNHIYPTWADVLSKEIPNAQYYNFGMSGAGNPLICSRIAEANNKFKFNSQDLIIVMFSTFYREDRYMNGEWVARGNVYNGCMYGDDFVKKFADPIGYIIRDLALIELTTTYLKSIPCTSVFLMAADAFEDLSWATNMFASKSEKTTIQNILDVYGNLLSSLPKSLKQITANSDNTWKIGHSYLWQGEIHHDSHPNPEIYYDYLKTLNFNLTEKSYNYVQESMKKLQFFKKQEDWFTVFSDLSEKRNNIKAILF